MTSVSEYCEKKKKQAKVGERVTLLLLLEPFFLVLFQTPVFRVEKASRSRERAHIIIYERSRLYLSEAENGG